MCTGSGGVGGLLRGLQGLGEVVSQTEESRAGRSSPRAHPELLINGLGQRPKQCSYPYLNSGYLF